MQWHQARTLHSTLYCALPMSSALVSPISLLPQFLDCTGMVHILVPGCLWPIPPCYGQLFGCQEQRATLWNMSGNVWMMVSPIPQVFIFNEWRGSQGRSLPGRDVWELTASTRDPGLWVQSWFYVELLGNLQKTKLTLFKRQWTPSVLVRLLCFSEPRDAPGVWRWGIHMPSQAAAEQLYLDWKQADLHQVASH